MIAAKVLCMSRLKGGVFFAVGLCFVVIVMIIFLLTRNPRESLTGALSGYYHSLAAGRQDSIGRYALVGFPNDLLDVRLKRGGYTLFDYGDTLSTQETSLDASGDPVMLFSLVTWSGGTRVAYLAEARFARVGLSAKIKSIRRIRKGTDITD